MEKQYDGWLRHHGVGHFPSAFKRKVCFFVEIHNWRHRCIEEKQNVLVE
jgi:hypothetical protein